jgi:hypothetical protein
MNEEALRPHATPPFHGGALYEATSAKDNRRNYGSVGGKDYCCLRMRVGCGIITLELWE